MEQRFYCCSSYLSRNDPINNKHRFEQKSLLDVNQHNIRSFFIQMFNTHEITTNRPENNWRRRQIINFFLCINTRIKNNIGHFTIIISGPEDLLLISDRFSRVYNVAFTRKFHLDIRQFFFPNTT